MILSRRLFAATIICGICLAASCRNDALAAIETNAKAAPRPTPVQVYLFRGLADIFSLGMDKLADRLRQQGYPASVYSTHHWQSIAKHIVANNTNGHKEIIVLVGHSLGADATLNIANELAHSNIPVEVVVTFDATQPPTVPRNVLHFVNFFQHNGFGKSAVPGPGFKGQLSDVDLTTDRSLSHVTIDKSDRLHGHVLGKIDEIVEKDLAQRTKASSPETRKAKRKN